MCSKVYDEITDFKVCRFTKSAKIRIVENKILFFLAKIKKSLIIDWRLYNMAKNNFLVEVTLKIILMLSIFFEVSFSPPVPIE